MDKLQAFHLLYPKLMRVCASQRVSVDSSRLSLLSVSTVKNAEDELHHISDEGLTVLPLHAFPNVERVLAALRPEHDAPPIKGLDKEQMPDLMHTLGAEVDALVRRKLGYSVPFALLMHVPKASDPTRAYTAFVGNAPRPYLEGLLREAVENEGMGQEFIRSIDSGKAH